MRLLVMVLAMVSACGTPPLIVSTLSDSPATFTLQPRASNEASQAEALNIVSPTQGGFTTDKSGRTATFTLALATLPLDTVTVTVASSNPNAGVITTGASLSFSTADWFTPQTVIVTGVDDQMATGPITYQVSVSAMSNDPAYDIASTTLFNVTNLDTHLASVNVAAQGLTTSTLGGTASFTVSLTSKPAAVVTVPVGLSMGAPATLSTSSLSFDNTNWSVPQTVTITGGPNPYADSGRLPYTVTIGSSYSSDGNYSALPPLTLNVTNMDTNIAAVNVVTNGGLNTDVNGGTATFNVLLNCEPRSNVTVPLSSSDSTKGTLSTTSLTFTSANWATPQLVTITGGATVGAYTVNFGASTSSDAYYNGLVGSTLGVTNGLGPCGVVCATGSICYSGVCTAPTIVTFSSVGSTNWTVPNGVDSVDVLVVGGGGGAGGAAGYGNDSGGGASGGGGGGGGIVYQHSYGVTPGSSIPVTVGNGGSQGAGGGATGATGSNGGNSIFDVLTAIGGGGGGGGTSAVAGNAGGSGGGGSNGGGGGSGTSGQGQAGGAAAGYNAGGGGGAGAAGSSSNSGFNTGAVGGNGLQFSIAGSASYYGGGGGAGGGGGNYAGGLGGGGGSFGGGGGTSGVAGTANTGGGGGGSWCASGAAGGSGIVIVRYYPTHGVVSFTTVGTTSWTVPSWVTSAEVLVVGGGGGGGQTIGGGGGGGGVIHQTGYGVTPGASVTITVGNGGNDTAGGIGTNGGNSIFGTLTAIGGGGGGGYHIGSGYWQNGASGGSGGGAESNAAQTGGSGTAGQGNAGANSTIYNQSCGGGGAGSAGSINGGIGLQFSISGIATYYGGGGGGGVQNSGAGAGGLGGGANGVTDQVSGAGLSGAPNTGGGGGGVGGNYPSCYGGSGGSGIVIVRY